MPRKRSSAATVKSSDPMKPAETENPVGHEGQAEFDGHNDVEETAEEEVEYEEVEEEVEEEEEEEEEVEEEVEEEDEEEEENDANVSKMADTKQDKDSDHEMKAADLAEDEEKEHSELLALPPHGSEVYLGGIPHDASEDDLKGLCESVGEVTEVRIMKGKDSSENKGYAFVTFRTKDLASQAIKDLNNTKFKGRKLRCSTSQAKHKLFIGNIPKSWGEEDIEKVVTKIGPGVNGVELLKDPQNSSRNRGFVFIEYYNHACAEYSRQKMSSPKFKLEDNAPTVSWADPKNAESSAASQVKAVYVKNLPKNITPDQLEDLFEHHGKITKVVLPPAKVGQEKSRFGFIHFAERSSALKALKNTEKYEIDGQVLECSLAKPQADQRSSGVQNSSKATSLPSYPPSLGYGLSGGGYGALAAGYGGAGFGQPLVYGRGPTPSGMAMMPMLLPDGRIGYVLQQPGAQLHSPPPQQRGRSGGGSSSGGRSGGGGSSRDGGRSGGRSSSGGRRDNGRGQNRYNPY